MHWKKSYKDSNHQGKSKMGGIKETDHTEFEPRTGIIIILFRDHLGENSLILHINYLH